MSKRQVVILVLDDLDAVCREIKAGVQARHPDWLVCTHETVESALAEPRLHERRISVAISDYLLPKPVGLDVLIKMMRIQPRLPTILITRDEDLDLGAEALRWGVSDFIRKVDGSWLEKLLEAVEEGVERWKNGSDLQPSCFAVMPYGGWLNDLYRDTWKPAARAAGVAIIRNDEKGAGGDLLGDIIDSIKTSSVVIADLTELRGNVLFEVGIAVGMKKPLILMTSQLPETPSDLRGFKMIVYDRDAEGFKKNLREELVKALSRAIRSERLTFDR